MAGIAEDNSSESELKEWYKKSGLPLVIDGDTVLVGFREAEWAEKLTK